MKRFVSERRHVQSLKQAHQWRGSAKRAVKLTHEAHPKRLDPSGATPSSTHVSGAVLRYLQQAYGKHHLIPPLQAPPAPEHAPSSAGAAATAAARVESLLVIFPGALLPATAFKNLAEAVQRAAAPHLRLWVGVLEVDWPTLTEALCGPNPTVLEVLQAVKDSDVFGMLLRDLIDLAADEGFVPLGGEGWISNLLVACQSAGALGIVPTAV
ncbi:hypothetical protein VaNZ11_000658, partial [Volvox africanus]